MGKVLRGVIYFLGIIAIAAVLVVGVFLVEQRGVTQNAAFLFVGTQNDADCTILRSGSYCVLIDTGEEQDGPHIAEVLEQLGVERIDCIILTHPDKDHVGGASYLLDRFPVGQLVTPYFTGEKAAYTALLRKAEEMRIPRQVLYRSRDYTYGDLKLRVFAPEKTYYENSNNYSLGVYVRHGENRLFWAGDAKKDRIKELLRLELEPVDLYHVAYHGRDTALSGQLLEVLQPEYAVVSGASPEPETMDILTKTGATVVTTVGRDVSFVSDGQALWRDDDALC